MTRRWRPVCESCASSAMSCRSRSSRVRHDLGAPFRESHDKRASSYCKRGMIPSLAEAVDAPITRTTYVVESGHAGSARSLRPTVSLASSARGPRGGPSSTIGQTPEWDLVSGRRDSMSPMLQQPYSSETSEVGSGSRVRRGRGEARSVIEVRSLRGPGRRHRRTSGGGTVPYATVPPAALAAGWLVEEKRDARGGHRDVEDIVERQRGSVRTGPVDDEDAGGGKVSEVEVLAVPGCEMTGEGNPVRTRKGEGPGCGESGPTGS